jgi:hypothetical protein
MDGNCAIANCTIRLWRAVLRMRIVTKKRCGTRSGVRDATNVVVRWYRSKTRATTGYSHLSPPGSRLDRAHRRCHRLGPKFKKFWLREKRRSELISEIRNCVLRVFSREASLLVGYRSLRICALLDASPRTKIHCSPQLRISEMSSNLFAFTLRARE